MGFHSSFGTYQDDWLAVHVISASVLPKWSWIIIACGGRIFTIATTCERQSVFQFDQIVASPSPFRTCSAPVAWISTVPMMWSFRASANSTRWLYPGCDDTFNIRPCSSSTIAVSEFIRQSFTHSSPFQANISPHCWAEALLEITNRGRTGAASQIILPFDVFT